MSVNCDAGSVAFTVPNIVKNNPKAYHFAWMDGKPTFVTVSGPPYTIIDPNGKVIGTTRDSPVPISTAAPAEAPSASAPAVTAAINAGIQASRAQGAPTRMYSGAPFTGATTGASAGEQGVAAPVINAIQSAYEALFPPAPYTPLPAERVAPTPAASRPAAAPSSSSYTAQSAADTAKWVQSILKPAAIPAIKKKAAPAQATDYRPLMIAGVAAVALATTIIILIKRR